MRHATAGLLAGIVICGLTTGTLRAQLPPRADEQAPDGRAFIIIKLFDANNPGGDPLQPRNAIGFYRDQQNRNIPRLMRSEDLLFEDIGNNFWRVSVPRNILVESITVKVASANGTDYNPATISKIVTRDRMIIYPGASDPEEKDFHIYAFLGQMATYQTILSQLLDEFPGESAFIKKFLLDQYGKQIEAMDRRAQLGRITDQRGKSASAQQLKQARDLANKVMIAYGLRVPPKVTQKPKPCPQPTYHQPYCQPWDGWRRCR